MRISVVVLLFVCVRPLKGIKQDFCLFVGSYENY